MRPSGGSNNSKKDSSPPLQREFVLSLCTHHDLQFCIGLSQSVLSTLAINHRELNCIMAAVTEGEEIMIASLALPPVIRHVRTAAKRAGLDPDEVLHRDQITEEGSPKSNYILAPDVIRVAKARELK